MSMIMVTIELWVEVILVLWEEFLAMILHQILTFWQVGVSLVLTLPAQIKSYSNWVG